MAVPDATMKVFFYGLFMDRDLLAEKRVAARSAVVGFVEGYRLRIGERATLQRSAGARAYGVMMEVSAGELENLYAEASVADYVPEVVIVKFMDGGQSSARCYNLPHHKVTGANKRYAGALVELAGRLGLPESYIAQIREAAS